MHLFKYLELVTTKLRDQELLVTAAEPTAPFGWLVSGSQHLDHSAMQRAEAAERWQWDPKADERK